MRWPWSRPEPARPAWTPPDRIPDGDTVLGPTGESWAGLLSGHRVAGLTGDTQLIPVITPAMRHRSRGGGWS